MEIEPLSGCTGGDGGNELLTLGWVDLGFLSLPGLRLDLRRFVRSRRRRSTMPK
jgi:hypothetical protein